MKGDFLQFSIQGLVVVETVPSVMPWILPSETNPLVMVNVGSTTMVPSTLLLSAKMEGMARPIPSSYNPCKPRA